MSGSELRDIAIALYGERGWQKQLASALGRDVSSVRRWVESDVVPPIVALAVTGLKAQSFQSHKAKRPERK